MTLMIGTLMAGMAGCKSPAVNLDEDSSLNVWLVKNVQDAAMRNAIIQQHTLFHYHFVPDSEKLNDLGKIDLTVLADHYRENSGELNVRKGNVKAELYEARLRTVREMLHRAGVNEDRVAISDGFPGGEGMSSERVLKILEAGDDARSRAGDKKSSATGNGVRPKGKAKTGQATKNGGQ